MAWAKITIIGALNYFKDRDLGLFDYLELPEGLSSETLIDTIVYKASDFELMHINPDFTRFAIGAFSRKWLPTWKKWYEALNAEYNPIWNYDRTEEGTDKHTGNQMHSGSERFDTSNTGTSEVDNVTSESTHNTGSQTIAHEGTQQQKDIGSNVSQENPGKVTTTTHENVTNGTDTVTTSVAGFNSSDWNNKEKTVTDKNIGKTKDTATESGHSDASNSSSLDSTRTDDLTDTRTDDLNEQKSGVNKSTKTDDLTETKSGTTSDVRTDDLTDTHTLRAFGNIGVTTTQQMIQQEIDLRLNNLYEMISDQFIQEFCIMIY